LAPCCLSSGHFSIASITFSSWSVGISASDICRSFTDEERNQAVRIFQKPPHPSIIEAHEPVSIDVIAPRDGAHRVACETVAFFLLLQMILARSTPHDRLDRSRSRSLV
jgi:hypothetical protein